MKKLAVFTYSKIITVILAGIVGIFASIATTFAMDTELYATTDHFNWKETNSTRVLMKESGTILRLGAKFTTDNGNTMNVSRVEAFGGRTSHTEPGRPGMKVDDNYYGITLENEWAMPLQQENSIQPFVGLGFKYWTRSMDSYITNKIGGYSENWTSIYPTLGIRQKTGSFFYEAGLKYPLYTRNHVDAFETTVKPKSDLGYFAEVGLDFKKCKISLNYSFQKYKVSDSVVSDIVKDRLCQPESEEKSIGLKFAYNF